MRQSEQLVYSAYLKRYGKEQADKWLSERVRPTHSIPQSHISTFSRAITEKYFETKARTDEFLEQVTREISQGEQAICQAQEIVFPHKGELGNAYHLVLGLVACALEANHLPTDEGRCNSYHVAVTFDSLGWMAARAAGRSKPYCSKTIQRWLSKLAPHAQALRRFIAWRPWFTDTMKNYSTGESVGAVVGCHVFRVYTQPLESGKVTVKGKQMRRPWRNLETDIKAGKTAAQRTLENVHIDKATKDDASAAKVFMHDFSNTPAEQKSLLQEHYVYPDISTTSGAAQLRKDVQQTARWLCLRLEDNGDAAWSLNHKRYLQAVWTAVKHQVVRGDSRATEMLRLAVRMASEIDHDGEATLKNKASYIWSVIEKRGFEEMRRDAKEFPVFCKSMYAQITAPITA